MTEMRFTISETMDKIVKTVCEKIGIDKAELGRIALVEYLKEFDFGGKYGP